MHIDIALSNKECQEFIDVMQKKQKDFLTILPVLPRDARKLRTLAEKCCL